MKKEYLYMLRFYGCIEKGFTIVYEKTISP